MQALRLSSVKRDYKLVLMFFRCEKDCSHAYVKSNIVSTAILTRCMQCVVCDGKRVPSCDN